MRLTYLVALAALWASPTIAAEVDPLWLEVSEDGRSLDFYFSDPSQDGENLAYVLSCTDPATSRGPTFTIIADDKNSVLLRRLADIDPFSDEAAAQFRLGSDTIAAPVWGYAADMDELNGGWDVTVTLGDPELSLFQRLAASSGRGAVKLVIVSLTYDLSPRDEDRTRLKSFLSQCNVT